MFTLSHRKKESIWVNNTFQRIQNLILKLGKVELALVLVQKTCLRLDNHLENWQIALLKLMKINPRLATMWDLPKKVNYKVEAYLQYRGIIRCKVWCLPFYILSLFHREFLSGLHIFLRILITLYLHYINSSNIYSL